MSTDQTTDVHVYVRSSGCQVPLTSRCVFVNRHKVVVQGGSSINGKNKRASVSDVTTLGAAAASAACPTCEDRDVLTSPARVRRSPRVNFTVRDLG